MADCVRLAPRPPSSWGQCGAAQPPSRSLRCQSRRHAYCASSPGSSGGGGGGLSASHWRSSSRKAVSVPENVRSIRSLLRGAAEHGQGGVGEGGEEIGEG